MAIQRTSNPPASGPLVVPKGTAASAESANFAEVGANLDRMLASPPDSATAEGVKTIASLAAELRVA